MFLPLAYCQHQIAVVKTFVWNFMYSLFLISHVSRSQYLLYVSIKNSTDKLFLLQRYIIAKTLNWIYKILHYNSDICLSKWVSGAC